MKIDFNQPLKGRRVLVAASGSIAAVKTPLLVSGLIKEGAEVRCILTKSAAELVSPLALSSLSRHHCYLDEDQWNRDESRPLHIVLSEWAEVVLVAPLSATSLARYAHGLADGLLASVLLASETPVLAAAAMNTSMWANPAVKRNWELISNYPSVLPLQPSSGLLACDRIGDGRMMHQDLIELALESTFLQLAAGSSNQIKRDWIGKRILITAGPTTEPLDIARVISNRSSGKMGVLLAQAAKFRGAEVDLIHGPLRVPTGWLEGLNNHPISTANEMQVQLNKRQAKADAIAMTAAIADIRKTKLVNPEKKAKETLLTEINEDLELVPDLLEGLGLQKTKNQVLLGFSALTGNANQIQKTAEAKRLKKGCDLMFANPIDQTGQGFDENLNGGWLLGPMGTLRHIPVTSKFALAHQLLDAMIEFGNAS